MPTPLNDLPSQRILSVDAFRGLTFVVMLFVNFLAGATNVPGGIHHVAADVDGMHLADVVFPAFMFAVGMSIPFGLQGRIKRGDSLLGLQRHIGYRALALVTMGVFMVNAESGYDASRMGLPIDAWSLLFYGAVLLVWGVYRVHSTFLERSLRAAGVALMVVLALLYRSNIPGESAMTPQWWGILGLIGWAYLVAALAYQLARGRLVWLFAAMAVCTGAYALAAASGSGMALAVHGVHATIVLAGTACALLFFDGGRGRTGAAILFATVLALAAWMLHHHYPVSKIGATPPWALYCAALCTLLFALLYYLIDVRGLRGWTALVEPAASNPLITYLLPFVLGALMSLLHLRWPGFAADGAGAVLSALLFSLCVVLAVAQLNRINFKLKI